MMDLVHYVPILTTLFCIYFAYELFARYSDRPGSYHLLWWAFGVVAYGAGTLVESFWTLTGGGEAMLKTWYIVGALMGGAPLAQGTVYLLLKRKTAHMLSVVLLAAFVFGSTVVILSPVNMGLIDGGAPQGKALLWGWVRLISPFINTYAVIFLVGGAVYSAIHYHRIPEMKNRTIGNWLIAIGAILPGIGGMSSRVGHTEVLYVAEIVGITLIYLGYRRCSAAPPAGKFARRIAVETEKAVI